MFIVNDTTTLTLIRYVWKYIKQIILLSLIIKFTWLNRKIAQENKNKYSLHDLLKTDYFTVMFESSEV